MANAERLDVSRVGYHDYPATSNSMLTDYLDSPRLFYKRWVAKKMPPKKETPQMRQGTLRHLRVLEPHRWLSQVVIAPSVDRRTKAGKEAASAFEASLPDGAIQVTQEEYDLAEEAYAEIFKHDLAWEYLGRRNGEAELAIAWDCDLTGLRLKALLDRLCPEESDGFDDKQPVVVDAKFVANPRKDFWKSYGARERGYHRQAAHYLEGASELLGVPQKQIQFVFVMVQNEQPYDIFIHRLESDFLDGAREELFFAKKRLCKSMATGDWHPPGSLSIQDIPQPLWQWDSVQEAR